MRNWDSLTNNDILGNPTLDAAICTQEEDYNDALSVANSLGLKLHRVDFIKEYWDEVFSIFLSEYKKGRTPNPDILCNKHIKFDHFFDYAMENGFDMVATGHYARVVHEKDRSLLLKGLDLNKDQSYFLAQISQKALSKTLFPLGDLEKPEVRMIADKLNLSVAKKKDSTGVCFIGERDFKAFLANYLPAKNGPIIDLENKAVIGEHLGVLYYTLGQRKGLDISAHEGPWFVACKDIDKNELYVVKEDNPWLYSHSALVTGLNWFNPLNLTESLDCNAKFRYRQKDQKVKIRSIGKDAVLVEYMTPIASVTPGQEAVFYLGDVCLGGGVIEDIYVDQKGLQERLKASL